MRFPPATTATTRRARRRCPATSRASSCVAVATSLVRQSAARPIDRRWRRIGDYFGVRSRTRRFSLPGAGRSRRSGVWAVKPPSTRSTSPVTNAASSEARYATAAAISSGISEPPDEMARAVAAEAIAHRAAERLLRGPVDDDTGRDRVAADPALAVRGRDVAGQRDDARLRRAVRGERVAAVERGRRRGVDDRRRRRARACAGSRTGNRASGR